jgi:ribosomal protein S27E
MGTGRSTETNRALAEERVVRTFLERAAPVILESRTLDGERFDAVLALAKDVGLTREQLSCELRFLELRGVITSTPWDRLDVPDDVSRDRARQRIEADGAAWGLTPEQIAAALSAITAHQLPAAVPSEASAPADIGLPSQPSPAESFRRWIKQKLAGYPSVVLAAEDEQGLVGVGAHRYHLAEVLAMHIVRDVATERDMRLERDLDAASCHSTVGGSSHASSDDQKLADVNDPRQLERREAFRSYLRRTLAQLPNGIVTFKAHRRLVEAGEHFHGVAPQWIKPTINEVAGEMGSRFISQEQAMGHVSGLVDELIAPDTLIDGTSRSRIYAEGTRWGLDPMDVEAILRERIEHVRQQAVSEKQPSRRIITLVGAAVIFVIAVLLWLFIPRPPVAHEPADADTQEVIERPAPAVTNSHDSAWWDNELQTAVANVRTAHPDLAAALEQAHSSDELDRSLETTQLENECAATLARRYDAALPRTAAEHPIRTDQEESSHRWDRLAGQADGVLRRTGDERDNPDILLPQALDHTYLATLACALAQGEEAAATFQELESQDPARLAIHDGPWPARPAEPFVTPYPVSSAGVIQQHIDSLANLREVAGRMTLLRLIANAADTLRDIDPGSGQKLAAYLLQPKPDEEHRQLLSHVAELARWNAVRLGLADQLAEAAGSGSQRQDVLRGILGNDIPLNTAEDRHRARRQLLQTVFVRLSDAAETGDARLRAIDQGSRAMRDLYRVQARLLRVPAETYASAQYPSAVLEAMISHLAGQLDTLQVTTEQRQLLDTLPHQLVAVDFVAENDLVYTTMLQRIWLQVLGMYVAQRCPGMAIAARGIVAETQASQASQDGMFAQMRDLEAGLLRLWMLYRLKTQDQPIRGYFVRENEKVVVVEEILPNGTTAERAVSRLEIKDLVRSVSDERLAALRPENPDGYRAYAEELSAAREDPDAQVTGIRLYLMAAHLDPQRLGRGCLLGMIPLARDPLEERRFRAMAYLLDPAHASDVLRTSEPHTARSSVLDPRQAELLLKPLRALRQGSPRDALALARRSKLKERLPLLSDTITYEEFESACAPTCPHCTRGRQPCPECRNAKFVSGSGSERVGCPTCGARGDVVCSVCGGNYQSNPVSPSLLERIVRLEMRWIPGEDPAAEAPRATRPPWSRTVQLGRFFPSRDLTLDTLTEFNPRQCRYRDGRWTE